MSQFLIHQLIIPDKFIKKINLLDAIDDCNISPHFQHHTHHLL